ncbi:NTP transferase domain-containing protein [Finegoldia magna]|uniref:NTP transferase domain-containing protein n=1 Tax=Finegoldia magna TaxID=1260 RepID=UPI00290F8F8E|nr:NTP transferase domain-containing protein [Finegoldia magna]MDU6599039.1 NTP transferase domain-containing protein [Finegoldia magna]
MIILKIGAVIMASGLSKRMKTDKLMLKYNDKFIFEYIIDLVVKSNFYDRIVITNNSTIIEYCRNIGIKAINNPNNKIGQSESIKLGVKYFNEMDGICFFVSDQPFLTDFSIEKLTTSFEKGKISQLRFANRIGNPVIFSNKFFNELSSLKNDEKGSIVKNNNLNHVKYVDALYERELMDIDTIDDYERILNAENLFD